MQYSWVYYRFNISFLRNITWKWQDIDRFITQTNSNFASSLWLIKWVEVEGSHLSFWKTPLRYRWLIWFRSMLSIAFPIFFPSSPPFADRASLIFAYVLTVFYLRAWHRLVIGLPQGSDPAPTREICREIQSFRSQGTFSAILTIK